MILPICYNAYWRWNFLSMIVIKKSKTDSKDNMLRKFSRLFKEDDIVFEVNRKLFYKNKNLLKKEKDREKAKRRSMKRMNTQKKYGKFL